MANITACAQKVALFWHDTYLYVFIQGNHCVLPDFSNWCAKRLRLMINLCEGLTTSQLAWGNWCIARAILCFDLLLWLIARYCDQGLVAFFRENGSTGARALHFAASQKLWSMHCILLPSVRENKQLLQATAAILLKVFLLRSCWIQVVDTWMFANTCSPQGSAWCARQDLANLKLPWIELAGLENTPFESRCFGIPERNSHEENTENTLCFLLSLFQTAGCNAQYACNAQGESRSQGWQRNFSLYACSIVWWMPGCTGASLRQANANKVAK